MIFSSALKDEKFATTDNILANTDILANKHENFSPADEYFSQHRLNYELDLNLCYGHLNL